MRPSRCLGQEKGGRAAAYPDVITVASHTKKDNPAGLPSKSSSPATAPGRPYVLTRNAGGHHGGADSGEVVFLCIASARCELPLLQDMRVISMEILTGWQACSSWRWRIPRVWFLSARDADGSAVG